MKTLPLNRVAVLMGIVVAIAAGQALAAVPHEPLPESYYRDLRSNYVRPWYIFKDTTGEGVLNPGDTKVEQMKNWWTPVSSGSQGLYSDDLNATGDLTSAPQNWATFTLDANDPAKNNPNYNYWLPRESNTIGFYMSYSQFDNCDWNDSSFVYGSNPTQQDIVRQRHMGRNGWSMGWVIGNYNDPNQTAGFANMDIAVHDGKLDANIPGWGRSISNPQVSMSNDIDPNLSIDWTLDYKTRHPAIFDDANGGYTWAANKLRMESQLLGYDSADLAKLVKSQELKEVPGFATGMLDHDGNEYLYQDAFTERSRYSANATDGGVIAGLSGYDELNAEMTNWGDQQVIRIEIAPETLLSGGITEIHFFDFGGSVPGSTDSNQVHPRMIVFHADSGGNLYFGDPNDDPNSWVYFPDNRIFIAVTDFFMVPEPATLSVITIGAGLTIFLRRRRST
jgi:hypothetical protein